MISPDIFKNVTTPGEAAALFSFQSSEFEKILVTEVEWLRKLLQLPDEQLKPLDRTTLEVVLGSIMEMIEYQFTQNVSRESAQSGNLPENPQNGRVDDGER